MSRERLSWSQARRFCAAAALLWLLDLDSSPSAPSLAVNGFIFITGKGWLTRQSSITSTRLFISTDSNIRPTDGGAAGHDGADGDDTNDDNLSDEQLLRQVPKTQLASLCEQCQLSTKGTKAALLKRLRDHANEQAALERKRRLERKVRVEEGVSHDGKEKYEIISEEIEEEDDEGYFYFDAPNATATNETEAKQEERPKPAKPTYVTNSIITAPPPPPIEPDENGERVVTVYSTKDQNDLTGIAAAQPGQNLFSNDAMMTGSDASSSAPWDMKDAPIKAEATSKELEEAKETVAELVHALLTMTGAPAFREEFSEGLSPISDDNKVPTPPSSQAFVGFNPATVPADILVSSSQALRAGRGQVLRDVLRDYELRAIGHDGMAGDNVEKGGGHYREVSKVQAFLQGYRRAEVRRVARETTTVLLDKLVSEGIESLDFLLASMSKSSDDTGDPGELNDSLLEYLNDAIRQQEKKVEQLLASKKNEEDTSASETNEEDTTSKLWNVTTELGQRVESIDPNDPEVQKILNDEYAKEQSAALEAVEQTPNTAPEQLLLLLTLLRQRIKAEAAFANDEKGRNLRLLAYCLNVRTAEEREDLITKQMGPSIDRLDSFLELVASSIEYAESTSHQLQPSKSKPLNLNLLKSILEVARDIREKQAWKASGVR